MDLQPLLLARVTQPDVGTFVWFDHAKETDWRIDSSAESAAAFADGLAALRR